MVKGKLPEVYPPSGRVPRRSEMALAVLEARRRRNRGEITKKGSVLGGFASRGINRRRGQPGGHQESRCPLAWPSPRPRQVAAWEPGGGPLAPLREFGRFCCTD